MGVTDVAQSPAAARPHALGLAVPARLESGPGAATGAGSHHVETGQGGGGTAAIFHMCNARIRTCILSSLLDYMLARRVMRQPHTPDTIASVSGLLSSLSSLASS